MNKLFKSEERKEMLKYMNISEEYFNKEETNFLGCEGSEIFDDVTNIKKENFKHSGMQLKNFEGYAYTIYIATVINKIELQYGIEKYDYYYLVTTEDEVKFVGGYYDDRIFKGEYFEGKTPFNKDIDIYTLDEALKLGFVEGIVQLYEETYKKDFYELSDNEKTEAILEYTKDDEIAGLLAFPSVKEAKNYKNEVLNEIAELEKHIKYVGQEQDSYGYFKEVYEYKK